MIRLALIAVISFVASLSGASAFSEGVPTEPRERVGHHLREVESLTRHFEAVRATACPRFPSRAEWNAYFESEVDRVVLLMAHLEQAWLEAKRTPDDEIRREAKAPRRRIDEARGLIAKLQDCADANGTSFAPLLLWRRIEREVPRKQAQIALP